MKGVRIWEDGVDGEGSGREDDKRQVAFAFLYFVVLIENGLRR